MHADCKILIVGGGIGGLATAASLAHLGITDFLILEQATELKELGAGVQMAPNASRVLQALGRGPRLSEVAVRPGALQARDYRTGHLIRDFKLGSDVERRYGAPYLHIHRAHLHRTLLDGVGADRLRLNERCVSITQDEAGVTVRTAQGRQYRGAMLIGADGVHSVVRSFLFGADSPRFSGLVAWRGLAPAGELVQAGLEKNVNSFWGPRKHLVSYFVAAGELVNWVGVVPNTEWTDESWSARGTKEEALNDFDGWHPIVRAIIEATDEPFKWALYDRDPMDSWTVGRVTMVGDAAHPMLPFMSQGAAQSIEDGYVLAHCIQRHPDSHTRAFAAYEAVRLERAKWVQLGSRSNGQMFHLSSPFQRLRRDLRFKFAALIPNSRERKKLETLYGFDCDAALARHFSGAGA